MVKDYIMKILFLTNDKKIYYNNGKIKEVKQLEDMNGVEIRFARPMVVYDVNLPLSYFVEELGDLKLGDYTVSQLTQLLYFHNFIVFVDHNNKKIEFLVDNGKLIEVPYSTLDFLRYYLAKIGRILLESESFEYLEALSHSKVDEFVLTDKALSKISATMSRTYPNALRRKFINNIINVLSFRRKQMKSS